MKQVSLVKCVSLSLIAIALVDAAPARAQDGRPPAEASPCDAWSHPPSR